jgi:trimeric autotransporter adhesin
MVRPLPAAGLLAAVVLTLSLSAADGLPLSPNPANSADAAETLSGGPYALTGAKEEAPSSETLVSSTLAGLTLAPAGITVTAANEPPTLSATGGNPTFVEDGAAVDLFSGVSISTIELGQTIIEIKLTVSGLADGANEILTVEGTALTLTDGTSLTTGANALGVSVSVAGAIATVTIGSVGGLSPANAQTMVDGLSYRNTSQAPTTTQRVVTLTSIRDSGGTADGGTDTTALSISSTVSITAVNDAPVITVPVSIAVNEDATTALTGISYADVDAGSGTMTATFSVGSGTLAATSSGGVTVSGSGTGTLTLSGSIANLNAFVAGGGATFTTSLNNTSNVVLTVSIADNGNSGSGGNLSDADTVTLLVTAVNDPPVNSVPPTQTVDQDAALIFSSGNGNLISISDVDAGGGTVRVTLTASNGLITLAGTAGLSFIVGSGSNDGTMTFEGTISDINIALNGLIFSPTPGYYGSASLQIVTNDLGLSGSGGAQTDSDTIAITVNSLNPLVVSVSSINADGVYGIGAMITITIDFNQTVVVNTSGGTPKLLLETGVVDRTASFVSGSGTSTLAFSYTVQAGDLSADLDYQSTSALSLDGATIRSISSDDAILTLPVPGGASSIAGQRDIVIDGVAPVVTSVSVPANGTYVAGQNLDFTVNFNEAVIVNTAGGTPRLGITLDSGAVFASYLGGSGSSALVFRYTVQAGDADADGIEIGVLQANGGTLRDAAANDADLTLNGVPSTAGILVDTSAPLVTSVVVPADGTYTAGQNLDFTVNFSEAVIVNTAGGTPRLGITLDSGVVFASYLGGSGSSALVFRYTVQAGDADADGIAIGTLQANGGTLRDAAANDADLTLNGVPSTAGVLVDTSAPVVTSMSVPADGTYVAGQNLDFTVNFNEAVIIDTGGGTPRLGITLDSGVVFAPYLSGSGSSALVFRYTVQAGDADADGIAIGVLDANGGTLRDAAANDADLTLNGVPSTTGIRIDTGAPSVTSVDVPADATYTAGQNLDFTVNFNEAVIIDTGGGTPRLGITLDSGVVFAPYLSGSGSSALVFRYTVQAGDADADGIAIGVLDANGGTLRDAAANDADLTLNGVPSTTGIRIDTGAPSVTSVDVPADATYTAGQNLDFTVNFSEAVIVSTAGGTPRLTVTLDTGVVFAPYLSGSGSSALVFRYTVQNGDADADGIAIGVLQANGGTLRDGASNDADLTLNGVPSTAGIRIDTGAPSVTSVDVPADGTYTAGQNLDFTVNFNEAVIVNTAGGTPRLSVVLDSGTVFASFVSGSGSNALLFRYTVAVPDEDHNGIVLNALDANGATLRDTVGNDALLALNGVPSTAGVLVDASPLVVISVTLPSPGIYGSGQTLGFTIHFNKIVIVDTTGGVPSLDLIIGSKAVQALYAGGSGSSALLFQYVIAVDDADEDGIEVTSLSANGATFTDAAGNGTSPTISPVESDSGIIIAAVADVPTADEWALILLALALAAFGFLRMKA